MEVAHVAGDQRQGQHAEQGQGRDLDGHQHGVDRGALLGADDQQYGHQDGDDHGGQVDEAADLAPFEEVHEGDLRPDGQGVGYVQPYVVEEAYDVAGPPDRHRA